MSRRLDQARCSLELYRLAMPLRFRKMHAGGDDFVVIDMRGAAGAATGDLARRLGDRHRGIGFNQLAVMLDCADAASQVDFLESERHAAGCLWECERTSIGHISVNMGEPLLHWLDVPLSRNVDTLSVPPSGAPTACRMGNPHRTFSSSPLPLSPPP